MISDVVQAACTTCGEVELRGTELTIRSCVETMQNSYRFRCPVCSLWTVRAATPGVVMLLLRAGAHVERWQQPAEFAERPDSSVAPLGDADLAAFLTALDDLPTIDR